MRSSLLPRDDLKVKLPRSSGILLHPTSLPGGRLGPRGVRASSTGWPRRGSRGGRCCRSGRPDGVGSPYFSASAFAGWRGLLAEPRGAGLRGRGRGVRRGAPVLERATGRRSPEPARSPTRCASSASGSALRAYAAERGVRLIGDLPIYVAPGGADHSRIRSSSRTASSPASPPDYFSRDRPALGQPDLRLARDARRRLPLVDRALPADVRARRPGAGRPLPRLRRVLVGARRRTRRRGTGAWRRGPGRGAVRRGRGRELGELPLDRRGPRRDHAGGRAAPRRPRPAGDARTAVRPRSVERHPAETRTVVYTGTHDNDTHGRAAAARPVRSVALDRARATRRAPRWRSSRRRTCSRLGSEARMNTPGVEEGNWTWRLRAVS